MTKVEIVKQCGCFTRRGMQPVYEYATKEEARREAEKLAAKMNEEFCGKHKFCVEEAGGDFRIVEDLNS
ncbi:MAG: hypothetical protein K6347_02525 [Campylobacterales bacterium]